jgi:NAD(P)H-dependent FMN reductase
MKLLALNASHRGDQGYTHLLLTHLLQGARAAGAQTETLTLARCKINRCLACIKCQQAGDKHLTCVYDARDDVPQIFDAMRSADILIFATPIYMMSIASLLKTLLDRLYATMDCADIRLTKTGLLHHHVDAALSSKPFVSLLCCANLEAGMTANAAHYFRTYARFMEAPQVGALVRNASPLLDDESNPRVRRVLAAYEQAGRELAKVRRIARTTQWAANQELVNVPLFSLVKRLPFMKPMIARETRRFYGGGVGE